jgi:putative oxidoreductase
MIALIFLISGFGKITGFAQTAAGMAAKGLPMAELLLVITIIIEIGGALMIVVGWKARLGATALFLWMIPVTLLYHNFWAMEGQAAFINRIMFLKNLAMMGAMLYIMAFGSGRYSIGKK